MFTAIGFRIAFYSLCGLIIALTTAVIVRRRLRAKRLLRQPPAVVADAASVRQQLPVTVDSDALPQAAIDESLIGPKIDVRANEISRNALAYGFSGL
ncbi:MAG: hypothetical protein IAG10_12790 [Planctomycetaceae bacterium]|nr:hypothetical protein [Planctomycetaceae bacterium]